MTTPAEEAVVKATVGNILMSDSCQKIDFTWDTYRIDGSRFTAAALTLLARAGKPGRLRVAVGGLPPDHGANYDADSTTLRVPATSFGVVDAWERSTIVHEATHICMDLLGRGKSTPGATEEMLAYVAAMLFNLHEFEADRLTWTPPAASIPALAETAAMGVMGKPRAALGEKAAGAVIAAIKLNPTYGFLKFNPTYRQSGVPF